MFPFSRGQLGNGEITPHREQPQLIEALAGVKIVDIAACGWHSGAVSSFGDLYTWGWNSKGQLGLKDEKRSRGSVFTLPQLIEIEDADGVEVSFEKVYCGVGYTVAISTRGDIYYAGNDIANKMNYQKVEKEAEKCGFDLFKIGDDFSKNVCLKCGPNTIILYDKSNALSG